MSQSFGDGNVENEEAARKKRKQRRDASRRRKRNRKMPRWKFYVAAGVAGIFSLLVVGGVVITVLEQFGYVI
jgi:hypothetical protein